MTTICSQTSAGPAVRYRNGAAGGGLGRALATLREWRRRIRERHELAGLSDRMLSDIGISRAEAEFFADKPFWRE
jgi:uncharacterized protein YjiS (DUF1127 family)